MNMRNFLSDFAEAFRIRPDELCDSLKLNEIELDSLGIIETIALVDEHFDITLKGDDLRKCIVLGDLLKLICNALDQQNAGQ